LRQSRWVWVVALLGVIGFGCANTPPRETMARAERSIAEAEQLDARAHARLELHLAEEHLAGARDAARDGRYAVARELAEKAEAEAQLAIVQRNAAVAEQRRAELKSSIEALRAEIERTSAGRR